MELLHVCRVDLHVFVIDGLHNGVPAGVGRVNPFEQVAADVQRPHALVAQHPLLPRNGVEVETRRRHVQMKVSARLGSVQHDVCAPVVGQPCKLGGGHAQSGGVLDVADEDHAGLGGEGRLELGQNGFQRVVRVQVHHPHPEVVPLGGGQAGQQDGAVLQVASDDFVSRLPVQAT